MKILDIKDMDIFGIKVIRFARFNDFRGYFTETFNIDDIKRECSFLSRYSFVQTNESFSFANTFRGLHIQPNMGKLVRLIYGEMIDLGLDLRKNSSTYKKIIGYNLQSTCDYTEWIWIPSGIAHGIWLKQNSIVEYFCTDTYNSKEQYNIPIFSDVINWELCDKNIRDDFFSMDRKEMKIKDDDLICNYNFEI